MDHFFPSLTEFEGYILVELSVKAYSFESNICQIQLV